MQQRPQIIVTYLFGTLTFYLIPSFPVYDIASAWVPHLVSGELFTSLYVYVPCILRTAPLPLPPHLPHTAPLLSMGCVWYYNAP